MASAIRIATLNLLYYPQGDRWRERRPLVEAGLLELAPDIIGLQEVNRSIDQDRALAAAAGPTLDYEVFRASNTIRTRYPRHWDGVVLLVRRSPAERAGATVPRFHEVRRLTHLRVVQALGLTRPDGTSLTIVNTHLHHPDGPPGHVARLRQVRAITAFLDELPRTDATILVGDLNGLPDEPAMDWLGAAGFRSATREAGIGDPGTFPSGLIAPTIYRGPRVCIDYVLVRGSVSVKSASLAFDRPSPGDPGLYPSDHLGLVADLEVSPG